MINKRLSIDPLKCTGCGDCETACALAHAKIGAPEKPRIRVIRGEEGDGFCLPTTCQHCEDPPCMAVCPEEAIYRDKELDRVMIDTKRCIGCKMCVSACPTGAMGFDRDRGRAFKCDLCGGDPACVRVCKEGALVYVNPCQLNTARAQESAGKLYGVLRHLAH
ncbi:MAG: 4Fe-4S dicluster domain-containing protein [Deltaproteobacteria bacterium]|nr:4Fe-4S dicluster domain-containing protein [Deltaproteobacteria bacterium]